MAAITTTFAAATPTSITIVVHSAATSVYPYYDEFDFEMERFRREIEEARRRRPPLPEPPPIDGYQPRPALPVRTVPRIMRVQSRGG